MRLPTRLLQRKPDAHKGDFGHIFILAGSLRFSGAAVLCAEATMRSGAGLVTLGIPKSLAYALVRVKPKEAMILPLPETKEGALSIGAWLKIKKFAQDIDVLVLGPGLGQGKSTQNLARKVITGIHKPKVIDADGLNALVGHLKILQIFGKANTGIVMTPHPGEMARLLKISTAKVQDYRREIAKKFSSVFRLTLVLKGHHTIVADYQDNLYINKTGNPGMSTAGSGDVLSGMIAAFMGQGLEAFEAAKYSVYLHGLAGDLAAKEKTTLSMVASDIIAKIPEAVKLTS